MATDIQVDFTGGEFSPFVDARIDNERYKTGMFLCRNYYPVLEGPVVRRPGTRFAHYARHDDKHARGVRFEFSALQAYIIEFGDLYVRFFKNHEIVREDQLDPEPINGVTKGATTIISTTSAHGWSNGDRVYMTQWGAGTGSGVPWTIFDHREFIIQDVTATTFRVTERDGTNIDSTLYRTPPGSPRVGRIYEVVSEYTEDEVDELRFVQSNDVLYIMHRDHPTRSLSRYDDDNWVFTDLEFIDGPYLPTNVTDTTMDPSGTSGSIIVVASSTAGINEATGAPGFKTTDVGRLIRLQDDALNWTWGVITDRNSATSIDVDILGPALANGNATLNWRLGLYSETFGYPHTGTFHEQRLWLGGAGAAPQRIDGTRTGGFGFDKLDFTPTDADGTVVDDHAVAVPLDSNDANSIFWLVSDEKGLLLGTQTGEWVVRASTLDEPITPTSIQARKATAHGSADLAPVVVGKSALFIQRAKRKLRELTYFYDVGGFQAPNLNLLADHMTVGGAEELAFQREPSSIVWVRRNDGVLLGVSYQREQDTIRVGWHQHRLGGEETVDDFYGVPMNFQCKSISVIPAPDGLRDELWMFNVREINGETRRTVEYLTKTFNDEDGDEDAYFMDMGRIRVDFETIEPDVFYTEVIPTSGLFYLEGTTVQTWIDGAVGPEAIIVNGELTFADEDVEGETLDEADTVLYGFTYTSSASMLRPEAGQSEGAALGKSQTIKRIVPYFYRTAGIEMGRLKNLTVGDDNTFGVPPLDQVIFRDVTVVLADEPPGLFTGLIEIDIDSDWSLEERVAWRQTDPCPGTILSVTLFLETQD